MTTKHRCRKYFVYLCRSALVVALLLLVSRNFVSRVVAERVASAMLETKVEIDSVFIGWGDFEIRGITVYEVAMPNQPQIEVTRLNVSAAVLDGLNEGVWVEKIRIAKPTLHLRFDEAGKLLSVFPTPRSSAGNQAKIPLRSIWVTDAEVIVHQGEHADAVIAGAHLAAEFGDQINIRGRIDKFVRGTLSFQTQVDTLTYEGSSLLSVKNCQLDCDTLPGTLLSQPLRDEGLSGLASLQLKIEHPAGVRDPRLHPATLSVELQDLKWSDQGTVLNRLDVWAQTNGETATVVINADPLGGTATLRLTSNSLDAPLRATLVSELNGCSFDSLIARFAPGVDAHANAALTARSTITWDGQRISLSNTLHAVAKDLRVEQVELDEIVCEVRCDAQAPVDFAAFDPMAGLRGKLSGEVASRGLDLTQLATRSGVPDLRGRILGGATFELPLDRWMDPNAVQANAVATWAGVHGQGVHLQDTEIAITVSEGLANARLADLRVVDSLGQRITTLSGFAQTTLASKRLTVRAEMHDAKLDRIAGLCGLDGTAITGVVLGQIDASSRIDSLAHPQHWTVVAGLQSHDVAVVGEEIDDVNVRCELKAGVLSLTPAILKWRDNTCQFELAGELDDEFFVDANFSAGPIRLDDLADVASRFSKRRLPLAGEAMFQGSIHVQTREAHFRTTGTSTLTKAVYAGTKIGSAKLTWNGDPSGMTIRTGSEDFFGGTYSVIASAKELDWTRATLDATFTGIQAWRAPRLFGIDLPVTGTFEGGCKLTSLGSLDDLEGNGWLRSRGLSVHKIPLELSGANLKAHGGTAIATAAGTVLKGKFAASGKTDLCELIAFVNDEQRNFSRLPVVADAALSGLAIEQAIQAVRLPESVRPLSGVVNATWVRNASTIRDGLIGTATTSIDRLRWQRARLSERITASIQLHPDRIELSSIDGQFADGRLSGRAKVSLGGEPRGNFELRANHVNLRLAAAPLGRNVSDVSGTGNMRIDGRVGRTITGRLELSANNPSVSKVNIRAVRLPVDWAFTPATSQVSWRCRAGVIEAGNGKIHLSSEGDYARSLNMRLAAKLSRIDTSKILRGGSIGAGILDGQVNLQAKRARKLEQLSGNFDFQMKQVDSLEMPILDQLDTLVRLTPSLGSNHSNSGTVKGRLVGAALRVDHLAISQSNVQLLMNGSASLDGRLDFDVTAATGQSGPADGLIAFTESPLMLAAPAPVTLVLKANDALKDRVVHVHVGGTVARPTLRLQPGKQLTQDTLRFFLTNSFGAQVANAADVSRQRNQSR